MVSKRNVLVAAAQVIVASSIGIAFAIYERTRDGKASTGHQTVKIPASANEFLEKLVALGVRPKTPYVLLEFGDFQCPACSMMTGEVAKAVRSYPSKITYSFVHFPLSVHPFAEKASCLVEVARKEGKAEKVSSSLWALQSVLNDKALAKIATDSNIKHRWPVTDKESAQLLAPYKNLGILGKIGWTPTFVLLCPDNSALRLANLASLSTLMK